MAGMVTERREMNDVKTKHIGTTKGSEEFRHSSQGLVPFLQQITRRVARPANCDESPTGSYKQTPTAQ